MKKRISKKQKKPSYRKLVKECDKLMSLLVRRKGYCERCGTNQNLQDSHIITRTKMATRWLASNHQCLCVKCHLYWYHTGGDPVEVAEWVISKIGKDTYDTIKKLSNTTAKFTVEDLETLKKTLEEKLNGKT